MGAGVVPPSYLTHISITKPIAPALKNYYIWSSLEVPTVFKPLLDQDGRFNSKSGGFRIETAVT
jgi:hypothetical protein